MIWLYFHGGPGFNAAPERHTFAPGLQEAGIDVRLWEEPSNRRPSGPAFAGENAFANFLKSAEAFLLAHSGTEPVGLIAHSYGANAAMHLIQRHEGRVAAAVFVAPVLSPLRSDQNVFRTAMLDFEKHGDPRAKEMETILSAAGEAFDENSIQGYTLLAQNPRIFDYYWCNRSRMGDFLSRYSGPEHGIDLEAFVLTRTSQFALPTSAIAVPALAVFGRHDVVASQDLEVTNLKRRLSRVDVLEFEDSAHYPHIEEQGRFIGLLASLEERLGRREARASEAATI